MPKYKIIIEESNLFRVNVDADDICEAKAKAMEIYNNGNSCFYNSDVQILDSEEIDNESMGGSI